MYIWTYPSTNNFLRTSQMICSETHNSDYVSYNPFGIDNSFPHPSTHICSSDRTYHSFRACNNSPKAHFVLSSMMSHKITSNVHWVSCLQVSLLTAAVISQTSATGILITQLWQPRYCSRLSTIEIHK